MSLRGSVTELRFTRLGLYEVLKRPASHPIPADETKKADLEQFSVAICYAVSSNVYASQCCLRKNKTCILHKRIIWWTTFFLTLPRTPRHSKALDAESSPSAQVSEVKLNRLPNTDHNMCGYAASGCLSSWEAVRYYLHRKEVGRWRPPHPIKLRWYSTVEKH